MILFAAAGNGLKVYNTSGLSFEQIRGQDAIHLHDNLLKYITFFSPNVRDIFIEKFRFPEQLKRLRDGKILWQVFEKFAQIDLHPGRVSNTAMGYLFEELIRRFSDLHETPAAFHPARSSASSSDLVLVSDDDDRKEGIIRTFDPRRTVACRLTEERCGNQRKRPRRAYGRSSIPNRSIAVRLCSSRPQSDQCLRQLPTKTPTPASFIHPPPLCTTPLRCDWRQQDHPQEHETRASTALRPRSPPVSTAALFYCT